MTEVQSQAAILEFTHEAAALQLEAALLAEEFVGRANRLLEVVHRPDLAEMGRTWHLWEVASKEKPRIVRRLVSVEQLKQLVRDLGDEGPGWFFRLRAEPCGWAHCRDGGASHAGDVAGLPHGVDHGPIFTVEVFLPSLHEAATRQQGFDFTQPKPEEED
jgi:hypothetical protein